MYGHRPDENSAHFIRVAAADIPVTPLSPPKARIGGFASPSHDGFASKQNAPASLPCGKAPCRSYFALQFRIPACASFQMMTKQRSMQRFSAAPTISVHAGLRNVRKRQHRRQLLTA
jgi:hypothetical protein